MPITFDRRALVCRLQSGDWNNRPASLFSPMSINFHGRSFRWKWMATSRALRDRLLQPSHLLNLIVWAFIRATSPPAFLSRPRRPPPSPHFCELVTLYNIVPVIPQRQKSRYRAWQKLRHTCVPRSLFSFFCSPLRNKRSGDYKTTFFFLPLASDVTVEMSLEILYGKM